MKLIEKLIEDIYNDKYFLRLFNKCVITSAEYFLKSEKQSNFTEKEFVDAIQKRYGGVPQQILEDAELRALYIPTLRADVQLMETYRYTPEPPLDCGVTAFAGSEDHTVTRAMIEGWRHQTNQKFEVHVVTGNHFFLQSAHKQLLDVIAADHASSNRNNVSELK